MIMAKYTLEDLQEYLITHYAGKDEGQVVTDTFSFGLGVTLKYSDDPSLPPFDYMVAYEMYEEVLWWHGFVRFGSSIGHVSTPSVGDSYIDAHDIGDGSDTVIFNNLQIPDCIDMVPATEEEIVGFVKKCYRCGYMYKSGVFDKAQKARVGDWVYFRDLPAMGCSRYVIVDISDDGTEASAIPLEEGMTPGDSRTIRLWRHECIPFKVGEKKRLSAEMAENGLSFDPVSCVFRASSPRSGLNEMYWYITDRFTVRAEQDRRTPAHDSRYAVGNYFTSPSEAEKFLSKVLALLHRDR